MSYLRSAAVVHIHRAGQLAPHGYVSGNALRAGSEFEVFAGVQLGFNLGNNGAAMFIDGVQRQAVCVEKTTNFDTCNLVCLIFSVA